MIQEGSCTVLCWALYYFKYIYINDITVDLHSAVVCYAGDTTLLEVVRSSDVSAVKFNEDLSQIADWCNKWIVEMNSSKTKSIVFSAKRDKPFHSPLFLNNTAIEDVDHHAHLGFILTDNLSWKSQITEMHQKAAKRLNILKISLQKFDKACNGIL